MASISLGEIGDLLGVATSQPERVFERLAGFNEADEHAIVFAVDGGSLEAALRSKAGLILAAEALDGKGDGRVLAVKDPKYGFALIARQLDGSREPKVHATALIEGTVGRRTAVGPGTLIEAGAMVGEDCWIGPHVTIHGCVTLGDRCLVQAGARLGGLGFGYARGPDGRYVRFPQIGTLRIEDDVEIGANTTIDRGALGETSIGRGTKIDNLVHIAHNCRIGEDVIMAAQVGLAGSCVIEDGAMLGGQVGLGERVTVGKGVILGGQGGLLPGKRLDGEGQVFWGTPARPVREYLRDVARMRKS